jgi:hypothetical protein
MAALMYLNSSAILALRWAIRFSPAIQGKYRNFLTKVPVFSYIKKMKPPKFK